MTCTIPYRAVLFGLLIVHATATSLLAQDSTTRPTTSPGNPRIRSPEVSADRRVTFRLLAPKASMVEVWTEWDAKSWPMTRDHVGVWSASFGPIEPNLYLYRFSVDGVETVDPRNSSVRRSTPPGSLVDIGAGESPYGLRAVPHGQVHVVHYDSKSLAAPRRMHVYLPPGYDPSAARTYPVLYLLHGSGNDDGHWSELGRAGLILDNLLAESKAQPMVIVMPNGHAAYRDSTSRARREAPLGRIWNMMGVPGAFADDITEDVIPYIETHYRVRTDRRARAIAGVSMGGNQAIAMGMTYPERFGYVLSFSGALMTAGDGSVDALIPDAAPINQNLKLLWIGCGKADSLYRHNTDFIATLAKRGIKHVWHDTEGLHTWPLWRVYLRDTIPLLFPIEN